MTKIPFFSMIAGKAVCPLKILKIYVRPSSPAGREKQESPNAGASAPLFLCARQDSNPQPLGPKPSALSIELRARADIIIPQT